MGERVYGQPMVIESADFDATPVEKETAAPLGNEGRLSLTDPVEKYLPEFKG